MQSQQTTKPTVVLVDDDRFWAVSVIRELEKRFKVVYIQDADEALAYFNDKYDFDAVVLDIMMASPDGMESETEDGHLTGVWLLQHVRVFVISANIPVIALTNHYDLPSVQSRVESMVDLRRRVSVHGKYGISRQELPALVEARILAVKGMG